MPVRSGRISFSKLTHYHLNNDLVSHVAGSTRDQDLFVAQARSSLLPRHLTLLAPREVNDGNDEEAVARICDTSEGIVPAQVSKVGSV
jgi:hypothetical protein